MKTKTPFLLIFLTCLLPLSLALKSKEEHYVGKFDYKCLLCKWTAKLIIAYHDEGAKPTQLFKILSKLCAFLGHQDKEVCKSMITNIGEQLFAILDASNGTILPVDICGMVSTYYLVRILIKLNPTLFRSLGERVLMKVKDFTNGH